MREPWLQDVAAQIDPLHSVSIDDPTRYDECERKHAYTSHAAANKKLAQLRKRQRHNHPLHVYYCPYGEHWHVGHVSYKHRPKGVGTMIAATQGTGH